MDHATTNTLTHLSAPTLSVDETAEAFGVARSTAYAAVRHGEWPVIKVRNKIRIPTAWVREQLRLAPVALGVGEPGRPSD